MRSLRLVKSASPTTFGAVGAVISYTYVVTNTGTVDLAGPVTVTDNLHHRRLPAGRPRARRVRHLHRVVHDHAGRRERRLGHELRHRARRRDGLEPGSGDGDLDRHASDADPAEPDSPVPLTSSIGISKTPATQTVLVGRTAHFEITVTNTGTATLTSVTVADPLTPNCSRTSATIAALGSLAPGASVHYACSLANVRAAFTNVATASATGPDAQHVTASDSAAVKLRAPLAPPVRAAVQIVKGPATQSISRGGTAKFDIAVRNIGNVVLRDVRVSDPRAPECNRRFATLAVRQTRSYSCTRTGVTADFHNVATVTGRTAGISRVARSTSPVAEVRVVSKVTPQVPAISIHKSPKQQVATDGVARFSITVKNTGNVLLHTVAVRDPRSPACSRKLGTLAPGASRTYGCKQENVTRAFRATATVTGVSPAGETVKSTDYAEVRVKPATPNEVTG